MAVLGPCVHGQLRHYSCSGWHFLVELVGGTIVVFVLSLFFLCGAAVEGGVSLALVELHYFLLPSDTCTFCFAFETCGVCV